ncbi:protein RepA, partial [Salmonella enterica]|nr:protein RepA [Salmonella enterica]
PPHDESAENPQLPATTAGDVSPEMTEKLALLEKLGITLDDLEKLFKSR